MKKLVLAGMIAMMAGVASAGTLTLKNDGWFVVGYDETNQYEKQTGMSSGTRDGTLLIGQQKSWSSEDGAVIGHRVALNGWGHHWKEIPKEGHLTITYSGNVFAGNQVHISEHYTK